MTAKQIKYFGTKAQKAGLKKKRTGKSYSVYQRRYVVAKKKKSYRKGMRKVSILAIAGLLPAVSNIHRAGSQKIHGEEGYFNNAATEAGRVLIGYDRRVVGGEGFNMVWLWGGTFPMLIGVIASKIAGRMGLNRMMSGIPFLKL